jgi:hypothetical protein
VTSADPQPPAPPPPDHPRSALLDRAPISEIIERAVVTPGRQRPEHLYSGEVWRPDGQLAKLSLRPSARARYRHAPIPPKARPAERLAGHHLFVGPLFRIFGHDLIELPGRLWPLLSGRFDGIVATKWRPADDPFQIVVDQTIATVLAAFDIAPRDVHVIERPTEVERLTVPEPAFHVNDFGLPVLRDCYQRIAERYRSGPGILDGRGLYLSRTAVPMSRIGNEKEVEAAARRAGLLVLHPQKSSLAMQIALVGEAGGIAGTDGSALHLAAFAHPGTRLVYFDTRKLVNQRIVNEAAGLEAHAIAVALGGRVTDPAAAFDLLRSRTAVP